MVILLIFKSLYYVNKSFNKVIPNFLKSTKILLLLLFCILIKKKNLIWKAFVINYNYVILCCNVRFLDIVGTIVFKNYHLKI